MKASVLPRRCSAMPDQLPTVSIGTVIFSHLRLRAAQRALSRLLLSQKCSVLACQAFGTCREARPTTWCNQVRGEPVGHEQAEDAAMEQGVAIEIGEAFPRDDRPHEGGW